MQEVDIAIIGAGVAGITASVYAKRANYKLALFEHGIVGGILVDINKITNYPSYSSISGVELALKMSEQLNFHGIDVIYDMVKEINCKDKIVKTKNDEYKAKAILIATGTSKSKLNIEGEDTIKGISYCAVCDGAFYKDKVVAIATSGIHSVDDALYLAKIVKKLYVISREDELKGSKEKIEELKKCLRVEIIYKSVIKELIGDPIEKIIISTGKTKRTLFVAGVFVCQGLLPNNTLIFGKCALDKYGYIITNENMQTDCEGIYAIGDIRSKPLRQIITACNDGAIAVYDAGQKYVRR